MPVTLVLPVRVVVLPTPHARARARARARGGTRYIAGPPRSATHLDLIQRFGTKYLPVLIGYVPYALVARGPWPCARPSLA